MDQYPMCIAGQSARGLIRTPPESDYLLKHELVAFMTSPKAEPVVKSMGIPARFVSRELNHTAAAHPTLRNCPFEHLLPKTGISLRCRDPDALDLAAPHPALRQTGKKCQLQRSNQAAILQSHRKKVTGISRNGLKGLYVARSRRGSDLLPFSTKLIIRKQGNDVLQVLKARSSHAESDHYALSLITQADTGLSSTTPSMSGVQPSIAGARYGNRAMSNLRELSPVPFRFMEVGLACPDAIAKGAFA
jgi:hypothetical protein